MIRVTMLTVVAGLLGCSADASDDDNEPDAPEVIGMSGGYDVTYTAITFPNPQTWGFGSRASISDRDQTISWTNRGIVEPIDRSDTCARVGARTESPGHNPYSLCYSDAPMFRTITGRVRVTTAEGAVEWSVSLSRD